MSKDAARAKLNDAINRGAILRPLACQECSAEPNYPIHGHHHDYDKPLDVEWLCRKCHRSRHPRQEPETRSRLVVMLPADLDRELEKEAARINTTKRQFVEDAIRGHLKRTAKQEAA